MTDWMMEVFDFFNEQSTLHTYFLAVQIMDTFMKNFQPQKKNDRIESGHIHLIGIASMFLATKYQDIEAITLKQFRERAGHGSYSDEQIKAQELEILDTLKFDISQPVISTYFDRVFYRNFQGEELEQEEIERIRRLGLEVCVRASYDYEMIKYGAFMIAVFALIEAIRRYYDRLVGYARNEDERVELRQDRSRIVKPNINHRLAVFC